MILPSRGGPGRRGPLILIAAIALLLATACLDEFPGRDEPGSAPGATTVAFPAQDGTPLDGRLWSRDPKRVVIYLHEYRGNQAAWWRMAERGTPADPSALTFDFRGHGSSRGRSSDIADTTSDVRGALAYARSRGFDQVMLVGAGMGAASALVAVADVPGVPVLALSAPSEFGELRPIDVIDRVAARSAFIAAEGDASARTSAQALRARGRIPAARIVIVKGNGHGIGLLAGDRRREAVADARRLAVELWAEAGSRPGN